MGEHPDYSTNNPPLDSLYADCWLEVTKDTDSRRHFGLKKYGKGVHAFDGRKTLLDVYEEQLDQLVYMKKLIFEEQNKRKAFIMELISWVSHHRKNIPLGSTDLLSLLEEYQIYVNNTAG